MHGQSAESFTYQVMPATRDFGDWFQLSSLIRPTESAPCGPPTGPAFGCSLNYTRNHSFPITEKQMTAWQKLPTLIQKILSSTTGTRTCDSSQAGTSHGLTTTSSMFRLEHMSSSALTAWCMERSGSGFKCSKATQQITYPASNVFRLLTAKALRTAAMALPWPFYHPVKRTTPPPALSPTCIARTMVRAGLIGSLSKWPCSGSVNPSLHQWWTSSLQSTAFCLLDGLSMTRYWQRRSD